MDLPQPGGPWKRTAVPCTSAALSFEKPHCPNNTEWACRGTEDVSWRTFALIHWKV
jgi:hypothetical protein